MHISRCRKREAVMRVSQEGRQQAPPFTGNSARKYARQTKPVRTIADDRRAAADERPASKMRATVFQHQ